MQSTAGCSSTSIITLSVAVNTPGIESSVIWRIDSTVTTGAENRFDEPKLPLKATGESGLETKLEELPLAAAPPWGDGLSSADAVDDVAQLAACWRKCTCQHMHQRTKSVNKGVWMNLNTNMKIECAISLELLGMVLLPTCPSPRRSWRRGDMLPPWISIIFPRNSII